MEPVPLIMPDSESAPSSLHLFKYIVNIHLLANHHQMLLRLNHIIGRRHELGFSLTFDPQDADVVTVADVRLADGLMDPFRQGRNLLDRVFLCQFNVIEDVIGAVAHRHLFSDITIRIDHLIRAVS